MRPLGCGIMVGMWTSRRAAASLVLAGVTACGRVGFATRDDAGSDDAGSDGSGVDALALGPFGTPERVVELDTTQVEDDFTLSPDMLEIILTRAPGTTSPGDLYRATRASIVDPFGTATPITELNTAGHDASPHVTRDRLTIFFTREQPAGSGNYDLWQATRATPQDPWQNPTPITELNSTLADTQAKLDETETRIAFVTASTNISLNTGELWEATRPVPSGPWNAPTKLAELNTGDGELGPCYAGNGLTLYFYSDRPGGQGVDIYRASRPTVDAPFGPAERLVELSSSGRDEDPWVSPDQRTIYFTRSNVIFRATR